MEYDVNSANGDASKEEVAAEVARQKKNIGRSLFIGSVLSFVVIGSIFLTTSSQLHWQGSSALFLPMFLPLVVMAALPFLMRSSMDKALTKQALQQVMIKKYMAERSSIQDPAQKKILDEKITLLLKSRKRPASPIVVLTIIGATLGTGIVTALVHPFRIFETFVLLMLITAPLTLVFGFVLVQGKPEWPFKPLSADDALGNAQRLDPSFARSIPAMRALIAIAATVIFSDVGLVLDKYLDHSVSEYRTFFVVEKHITHNKNSTAYHIRFASPVNSPISGLDLGGQEDVQLDANNYNHVVPGQTQIQIGMHPGFFHLPWRDGKYSLSNLY